MFVRISKPVAKLYGQNSPVFKVQVDSVKDRVYSIGNDNTVNVSISPSLSHSIQSGVIVSMLRSAFGGFHWSKLVKSILDHSTM